jgi:hypothetical protein
MTAVQIASLPESAFALPSSYYASVEVTHVPGPPEPTDWSLVEWFDGPTLVGGWDAIDARLVGAVPAKEMGR